MNQLQERINELRTEWHSLSDIVTVLNGHSYCDAIKNLGRRINRACLKQAEVFLSGVGFRKFKFLDNGGFKICLLGPENQLIKISFPSEIKTNSYHPAILQPIFSCELEQEGGGLYKIGIEVCSRVVVRDCLFAESERLEKILGGSGLQVSDLAAKNIGFIKVGEKELPFAIDIDLLRGKDNGKTEHLKDYILPDGRLVQHAFDARIGSGAPSGLISEDELMSLDKALSRARGEKRRSAIIEAIIAGGLYAGELAEILEGTHTHDKTESFSSRLLAAAKAKFINAQRE